MIGDVIILNGGFSATILWENTSERVAGQTFSAQTISNLPDMTKYAFIGINFQNDTNFYDDPNIGGALTAYAFADGDRYVCYTGNANSSSGGWRPFTVDATSISFEDATNSYEGSTANQILVPLTIFGVGHLSTIIPKFTYTGKAIYRETDEDWEIKFLTSGDLTFTEDIPLIDTFLVGGGGGGAGGSRYWSGGGGGGGYTTTKKQITLVPNTTYNIVVGGGGASRAGTNSDWSTDGGAGGNTSAFGFTASGGHGGIRNSTSGTSNGGAGGSGGGGGERYAGRAGAGGSDGTAGYPRTSSDGVWLGGAGQGTTTRAFGDANGELYSNGGYGGGTSAGASGAANTGNGGAGGGSPHNGGTGSWSGAGGSGIVIIRKAK